MRQWESGAGIKISSLIFNDLSDFCFSHSVDHPFCYDSEVLEEDVYKRQHIIRATLESIAYQVCDVLNAMEADSGISLSSLKVDGGASANNFLMQTQADLIGAPVKRPCCIETTAMGAAYLAGLSVGYWKNKEDVLKNWAGDRTMEPSITQEERKQRIKGWKKACLLYTSRFV